MRICLGSRKQQAEVDFENEGGETYICGNPPYLGSTRQSKEQKDDLKHIFEGRTKTWKSLGLCGGLVYEGGRLWKSDSICGGVCFDQFDLSRATSTDSVALFLIRVMKLLLLTPV